MQHAPSPSSSDSVVPGRRSPSVLVAVGALGAVTLAMAAVTVTAVASLGSGVLGLGAQVFLVVLYLIITAALAAATLGLLRGRGWTRSAATAAFLFCVLLSSWMIAGGDPAAGLALLAVSGAGLIAVMTRGVSEHLGGPSTRG